jgi:hypothetical protein
VNKPDVTLDLTHDQALVLSAWLWRESDNVQTAHEAERVVLWDIECQLERIVMEPFRPDYESLLEAARARLVPGSE